MSTGKLDERTEELIRELESCAFWLDKPIEGGAQPSVTKEQVSAARSNLRARILELQGEALAKVGHIHECVIRSTECPFNGYCECVCGAQRHDYEGEWHQVPAVSPSSNLE